MKYHAYCSILRVRLIAGLQYRVAALAGLSIHLFWGAIQVTIMLLFYRLGDHHNLSMTVTQAVTYIWFAQCFINLMPFQLDNEVAEKISSGDFAYELCRPLDIYAHWFARAAAARLSSIMLKSGLALTVCALLPVPYRIQPPHSLMALFCTILTLGGAFLLSCAFSNVANTLMLRVDFGLGYAWFLFSLMPVFSGSMVPLAVFPGWLQPLVRALPFAGLIDSPCGMYSGVIPVTDIGLVLGKQLGWTIALIAIGRWGFQRGLRRVVIQGG